MTLLVTGAFLGFLVEAAFQPRFLLVARRPFDWLITLIFFVTSGAIGGMLSAVQLVEMPTLFHSDDARHWKRARRHNVIAALAVSAAGGIGGAIAAMFVMILDGKIQFPINGLLALRYISTGVVAGFLGFQFLKIIAKNFGDQFGAEKVADARLEQARKEIRLSEAISLGLIAQGKEKGHKDIALAIGLLEAALKDFPADRRANIVLGELYGVKQDNVPKEILLLERAAEAMKQTESAEDRAAIFYNLACLHSRLANLETHPAEKDRLRAIAIDYLKKDLDLWSEDRRDAWVDPDFRWLREARDLEFVALVRPSPDATAPPDAAASRQESRVRDYSRDTAAHP